MGTIVYHLRSQVEHADKARELVAELRRCANELAFQSVGDMLVLTGEQCDPRTHTGLSPLVWMLIQCQRSVTDPLDPSRQYGVVPVHVIAFATYLGPGCEAANFGLCRYPETIEADGRRIETRLDSWYWGSFCKTQYAGRAEHGGRDNFRRCHLAIVELLHRAQRLDILETVHDEAGLWDNHQLIAGIFGLR